MHLIQVTIIAFALFAVWRTVIKFRSGELGRFHLVLWLLLWAAAGFLVALPQATSWLAVLAGVGRGVDVAIYLSVVVLFYLTFRLFVRLEKIEHDITLLVREMGLKDRRPGALEEKDRADEGSRSGRT
ncbi:DUF2304 domain-containing protein [Candidatus Uhrbacteria bacterium CG_4_10_14_0_8_um_filter_58_22]|uniref:DUF2304 domain-containing protein n=1 Tax=Candidatus Uhrbacteria bacterium CG_4_10_14_0_8_um_filter_58_22 TaxID=1975029 RepID=A0A2M7QAK2_9BACT|nr:MAG: hypothetical protein AUJ19_00935 [Parcubacteria group bacterium CG1_02_58_44]PIY62156.1 MAG: DUF2304 domain-containing protein [Candidatus Uhrbacteria bacterium CG_4_10_14_0_8_um_filter_58_22]